VLTARVGQGTLDELDDLRVSGLTRQIHRREPSVVPETGTRPGLEQPGDDLDVLLLHGAMEGSDAAAAADVRIRAGLE